MGAIQLNFLMTEEECEMAALRKDVENLRKSSDKVRKGTYALINELNKECIDLKIRLEIIEKNICKGIR